MILTLISSLVGCDKKEEIPKETVSVREKFDDLIPSLCLENIGDVDECLEAIDKVLLETDIPLPYSVFDNRHTEASQLLQFDTLDSVNRIVHVEVKGTNVGVKVAYSRDTSEEDKEKIVRLLKEMLGEDVYVTVDETYTDYVIAHAQGNEYKWKDGDLERMP